MSYFLRYPTGTAVKDAVHAHTLGKHDTLTAAIEALDATPEPWRSRLEIVRRQSVQRLEVVEP